MEYIEGDEVEIKVSLIFIAVFSVVSTYKKAYISTSIVFLGLLYWYYQ